MSHRANKSQYVRRVVLPSGRTIEVVYFETPAADGAVTPVRALKECPRCDGDLVYPVEWEEVSPTHWEVLLRCPNCERSEVGRFDQATVDRFDEHLEIGTDLLRGDLRRLQQANMAEQIEQFARALETDAILPEDF